MFLDPPMLTAPFSRVFEAKQKTKPTTVRREVELLELRNALSRNLLELRESQRVYMPGLGPILEDDETPNELAKLWLPSELSSDEQVRWCLPSVPALEFRFRYAQADDSLADIRRLRRMLQGLRDQNTKHPSLAQKSVTRTKGLFDSFQTKISRVVSRYRHSYQAMLALDPSQELSPGWMQRFRKLADADIRGPGRESDEPSDGTFQPSWIWLVPRLTDLGGSVPTADTGSAPSTTSDAEVAESMRVHWARCQARADRYEEEVMLIVEEMGRTVRYFEWRKSWWLSLRSTREESASPPSSAVCQGLHAYSSRQAHVYGTLVTSFVTRWRKLLVPHGLGSEWTSKYSTTADFPSAKPSRCESITPKPSSTLTCDPPAQVDSSSLPPPPLPPSVLFSDETEVDPPMDIAGDSDDEDDDNYVVEDDDFDFDD